MLVEFSWTFFYFNDHVPNSKYMWNKILAITIFLQILFLYYRYDISSIPLHQRSKEDNCQATSDAVILASSNKVNDLKIGVASFCKAFPWHFITDKRLELVQLGKSTKYFIHFGWLQMKIC